MLFTAPSFLFLFLPLSLSVYILVPQQIRRYVILLFNVIFYCVCTAGEPISMLLALLTATFTYSAGYTIAVTHRRRTLWSAVVIHLVLFLTYRYFYLHALGKGMSYYPFASSIYLLASLSYLIDIYRSDAPHAKTFADLLTYMFFFPMMIIGPILRYKNFTDMIDHADISLPNFCEGVKRFILGFFKRIGIAAVLAHTLDSVYAACSQEINFFVALLALLMLCAQVYFTLAGYSDMACGIMYMFGIPYKSDFHTPFSAMTHAQYYNIFFASFNAWINDYLVKPILHLNVLSSRSRRLLADVVFCVVSALWFKTRWYMLIVILPLLMVRLLRLGVARKVTKRFPFWVRRIAAIGVSAFLFALLWSAVSIPYGADILTFLNKITLSDASTQFGILYPELSYLRYLSIGIIGLICIIPFSPLGSKYVMKMPRWLLRTTLSVSVCGMLGVFAFSIIQLLPKFPEYTHTAFKYLVL